MTWAFALGNQTGAIIWAQSTGAQNMAASIRAYLLIETQAGTSNAVLDSLKSLDQTVQVDRVTGPYDIICVIETDSLNDLAEIVREHVHAMHGVTRTMSCMRLGE